MNHRVVTVLLAAGLLGGCSSSFLDNAFEYPSLNGQKAAPAEPNIPESVTPSPAAHAAFVSVPVAPALGSTETHQSLRAGTAPPETRQAVTAPPSDVATAPVAAMPAPEARNVPAPPVAQPTAPSYAPAPPTTMAQAQVAPSSDAEIAPDSWCVRVAKSAQAEAAEQGFDAATQQRRALTALKQCSATAR